jgi:membrane fusion protein, multidrug efflux system
LNCAATCISGAAVFLLSAATLAHGEQQSASTDKDAVRGIVRAVHMAMISTDLQARASRVALQEGEHFKKDDVLVEFDCRKQRAELASAEAQRLEMNLNLDNLKVLQRVQAAGRHDLEISQARLAKASAEADVLRAHIDECSVIAPFNGRILELALHEHERPAPGKAFIGLVADDALEIDLIVSSKWTPMLKVGTEFTFYVDETHATEVAVVRRIGAAVDPISQTIKIVAVFKDTVKDVLPGMSGTAQFDKLGG